MIPTSICVNSMHRVLWALLVLGWLFEAIATGNWVIAITTGLYLLLGVPMLFDPPPIPRPSPRIAE